MLYVDLHICKLKSNIDRLILQNVFLSPTLSPEDLGRQELEQRLSPKKQGSLIQL